MSFSPSNVKVHFAGYDNDERAIAVLKAAGVRYRLFTSYPFIKNRSSDCDMKVPKLAEMDAEFEHVIMDSGLFTMMFGADKGTPKTPEFVREWMHRICAFATQNHIRASIVECDCQKLISPEFAWELRREMRQIMPQAEIINVFHLADGQDGFRRLVDFTDYLAISVPELRIAQPKTYKNTVCALARMARRQKPGVKIHLLGCTERYLLENNRFCTTADSSSWTSSTRFGTLDKVHIKNINDKQAKIACEKVLAAAQQYGMGIPDKLARGEPKVVNYTAANYYTAQKCRKDYTQWAGPQD